LQSFGGQQPENYRSVRGELMRKIRARFSVERAGDV